MDNAVKDIDITEWVTVKAGSSGYLGRVSRLNQVEGKSTKEKTLLILANCGGWLELNPCFDFMTPIRPMQDPKTGRIVHQRELVVVPLDFTSTEIPVLVQPNSIVWMCDLQEGDRNVYKGFVEQALNTLLRLRAQASGLELVGGGNPGGFKRG